MLLAWTCTLDLRLPCRAIGNCHVHHTHSHHIVPAFTLVSLRTVNCEGEGGKKKVWYPIPFLPFSSPSPMPACWGWEFRFNVEMKLKQAASEAVRPPDCFNQMSAMYTWAMQQASTQSANYFRCQVRRTRTRLHSRDCLSLLCLPETGQRRTRANLFIHSFINSFQA